MDTDTAVDPEKLILDTIKSLLARRGGIDLAIEPTSKLTADLGMDSLELAELSAVLEDELGDDPYTAGLVPETVAELVGYYRS